MSVLILHQGSLAAAPYDRWLRDYDGDLLLLASREHLHRLGEDVPPAGSGYARFEALDNYQVSGRVEARALALAREYGVSRVIACHERDLERAAQLREVLGLPGQRLESAVPFRDKLVMKSLVRDAGVPVAPFADIQCAVDVVSFVQRHGYPVVLKPRDGGECVGVRLLRTPQDLETFLTRDFDLYGPGLPNLLAEAYVPGALCHIDGLVVGNRTVLALPSQYLHALVTYRQDRGGRLDVTLDPEDPLAGRLLEFTERVLQALPGPDHFAFRAEVFHTPDDELLLCEIASRAGGRGVRDVIRALYGLDPSEYWVRAQVGLPLPAVIGEERLEPAGTAGRLLLMKRPGEVISVPEHPGFPWVERYRIHVEPGQRVGPPEDFADLMASFVVSAPSRTECEERMRVLGAWFDEHVRIAEPQPLS
ncbi:ATP-binding protein [Wenjunlia tyrosinilytica]|uniref:Carboxylate--amine ligase n=1 Tax=Wenjunlia tyrosinilytica TaxID=1544741 RepID=A0A918E1D5_9ACTN|nr:hypothetical protein [Wenjunlia tyrosinilytica]GGO95821.1 carboxylate--amine ligase [Wenjunlia tyrosinilytica]